MSQTVEIRANNGGIIPVDDTGRIGISSRAGSTGKIATQRIFVTSSPAEIITKLSSKNRTLMRVMNITDNDMFVGSGDNVGSGDGYPIFAQSFQDFPLDLNHRIFIMQSAAGSGDARILEVE